MGATGAEDDYADDDFEEPAQEEEDDDDYADDFEDDAAGEARGPLKRPEIAEPKAAVPMVLLGAVDVAQRQSKGELLGCQRRTPRAEEPVAPSPRVITSPIMALLSTSVRGALASPTPTRPKPRATSRDDEAAAAGAPSAKEEDDDDDGAAADVAGVGDSSGGGGSRTARRKPVEDEAYLTKLAFDEGDILTGLRADEALVRELRSYVLGEKRTLPLSWRRQGLAFVDRGPWGLGIVQFEGGPCAVVAAAQAHVVDEVAKGARGGAEALERALVTIIWRAAESRGPGAVAVVCTLQDSAYGKRNQKAAGRGPEKFFERVTSDGVLTDRLVLNACRTRAALARFVAAVARPVYATPKAGGATLLLLSTLLTRGLRTARADGDDPSRTLIDSRGFGNFECVNLLVFGVANSNTFDGSKALDGLELRGAPKRADVGLLAYDEAKGYFTVGDRLKHPASPVWIVYSESHFSVLWQPALEPPLPGEYDERATVVALSYWDPLAAVEDEASEPIRLSATPAVFFDEAHPHRPRPPEVQDANALVPPLDVVIRTRWKTAAVEWHDTDPIL